jgi:hypothetical protein
MAGLDPHPINYDRIPACTYCDPEVASVGLTEAAARSRGIDVKTGKFPFAAIGKAAILGETGGFVKIVADAKYDEVLGVHIIGPRATELIAEASLGLQIETTGEEMIQAVHPIPPLRSDGQAAPQPTGGRSVSSRTRRRHSRRRGRAEGRQGQARGDLSRARLIPASDVDDALPRRAEARGRSSPAPEGERASGGLCADEAGAAFECVSGALTRGLPLLAGAAGAS